MVDDNSDNTNSKQNKPLILSFITNSFIHEYEPDLTITIYCANRWSLLEKMTNPQLEFVKQKDPYPNDSNKWSHFEKCIQFNIPQPWLRRGADDLAVSRPFIGQLSKMKGSHWFIQINVSGLSSVRYLNITIITKLGNFLYLCLLNVIIDQESINKTEIIFIFLQGSKLNDLLLHFMFQNIKLNKDLEKKTKFMVTI